MQNNINEWENENTEQFESDEYISDEELGAEDDDFEDSDEDEYSEEEYEDDEADEDDESDESDEDGNADENNNGMKRKLIVGGIAAVLLLLLIGGGFAGMHLMKKHASNSDVANVEEAKDINAEETISVNNDTVVDENGEELSVINIENEDASEQKTAENPVLPSDENGVAKTDNSSLEIDDTPKPVKMDNGLDIDDVKVSIGDVGRKNPFVPFAVDKSSAVKSEDIIQTSSIGFDVIEPPSLAEVNPEISKLFSTKVSGILYDEIRPSAILNIDGFDQLVRIGDTLGEFSILNITKNKVIIKSGVNVYRASVGQPLNAEKVVTSAEISNLEHKFYGSNKK